MQLRLANTGNYCIIDSEDFPLVQGKHLLEVNGYAAVNIDRKLVLVHKLILPNVLYEVDHRDRNKLNCRRSNLRDIPHSHNIQNAPSPTGKKYKGVYFRKSRNKYYSMIMYYGKHTFLGYFKTEEEAAIAYNEAALIFYGEGAFLNEIT